MTPTKKKVVKEATKKTDPFSPKAIERRNAKFHALSAEEKRIAIAKDVIASLRIGRFEALRGTYLSIVSDGSNHTDEFRYYDSLELQQKLLTTTDVCRVCGVGSIFVSAARCGNKLIFNKEVIVRGELRKADAENNPHYLLTDYFEMDQLAMIECAFERSREMHDNFLHYDVRDTCVNFGYKYNTSHERLIAIMKNIIKHNGEFKPEVIIKLPKVKARIDTP